MQETQVRSLDREDPFLEKEMAIHSSLLAWKITWIEEPGGLQSRELQSWTQLTSRACARTHTHTHTPRNPRMIRHQQQASVAFSSPWTRSLPFCGDFQSAEDRRGLLCHCDSSSMFPGEEPEDRYVLLPGRQLRNIQMSGFWQNTLRSKQGPKRPWSLLYFGCQRPLKTGLYNSFGLLIADVLYEVTKTTHGNF